MLLLKMEGNRKYVQSSSLVIYEQLLELNLAQLTEMPLVSKFANVSTVI